MMEYRELKKYKYELMHKECLQTKLFIPGSIETKYIRLGLGGFLTVRKHYCWDGETWSWDTDTNRYPSLMHDALCQLIELGLLPKVHRKAADILYRELCIAAGMSKFRAWIDYRMIRLYVRIRY